jgi:DNA end-binding protein Ku
MGRAIWSGSISFGLVNIPVKLYTAVRDRDVHFHMLSSDGKCRLRRKLVCPESGREYDFDKTAKGYEVAPDQYVIITQEELEQLRPESGRAIEIESFVALDDIDPMLFDRPYYLVPDKNGSKPYRLLLEALSASRKVAVARIVMRTKEYLAVVRPIGDALCLETLRYADEVVAVGDVEGIPEEFEVGDRELAMADQLIEHLTTEFNPADYRDEFRERVEKLIEAKAAGEDLVVQEPSDSGSKGNVINLMEALKKSLEGVAESSGAATTTKRAAAKNAGVTTRSTTAAKKSARAKSPAKKPVSDRSAATASAASRSTAGRSAAGRSAPAKKRSASKSGGTRRRAA